MAVIKGPDGLAVEVDDKNRLSVFAVSETEDKELNKQGKVWSLYFTVTPTGANDLFFYLKNNGTKNLFITSVRISSTVTTKLFYNHVSGTPVGGTAITPANRNLGSSSLPTATIEQGVDITGLTSQGVLFFEQCSAANERFKTSPASSIIIPQGQAVAFERVEATGLIDCVVSLVEFE